MNEHDRNNLDFILSADLGTLIEWGDKVTQDDFDYAFDLLKLYSEELLEVELTLGDFKEANAVISKIKNSK